jgi:hypothetical protein
MSNTDFEDAPNGETASEELVLDAERAGEEAHDENVGQDAGDESSVDAKEGGAEEVRPRRNSANETIRELRSRAQQTETRAAQLEREIMEIKAAQQAARQQPSPEQEQERLAMMTPEERSEYKLNKALTDLRREQALTNFRNEDRADKALFEAKATADKVYAKYAEKVEAERLRQMRENNMVIPREELLKWIVGQDVLQNRGKKAAQAERKGQDNIRRQTAPVANGRGNTQANRQSANANTQQARRQRLENVQI